MADSDSDDNFDKIKKRLKLEGKFVEVKEDLPRKFTGFTPGPKIKIKPCSGKSRDEDVEMQLYYGYSSTGEGTKKKQQIFNTPFVQLGVDRKSTLTPGNYMKYEDIAWRTFQNSYAQDKKRYEKGQMPIPLWDQEGIPIMNLRLYSKFFEEPELAKKGAGPKDTSDQSTHSWKPTSSKRVSRNRAIYSSEQYDRDTTQKFRANEERKRLTNDQNYQTWINVAFDQCRLSASVGFDVIGRFFDQDLGVTATDGTVSPIEFIFRITHEWDGSNTKRVEKLIHATFKAAADKCKFKPKLVEIWQWEPAQVVSEKQYHYVGAHPGGLYELWMPIKSAHAFIMATNQGYYPFPNKKQAEKANELLGLQEEQEHISRPNKSRVTSGGIKSARNTARHPQQSAVMNYVSPNDLVLPWWGKQGPKLRAEWLHRCAFSFGGIYVDSMPGTPNSAQVPGNLVIGTVEANTKMIRNEGFIKRIVQHTNYIDVEVETTIAYPKGNDNKWMQDESYLWLAPVLVYKYTLIPNEISNHKAVDSLPQYEYQFHTFTTGQVTRFEHELDLAMEKLCLEWNPDVSGTPKL